MKAPELAEMQDKLLGFLKKPIAPAFEPTGAMEPMLIAVGNCEGRIILNQSANKLGKTAHAANILRAIIWGDEGNPFFDYPMYKSWPHEKRGRIVGTKENVSNAGPIMTEITKWWPTGRYTFKKDGHHYNHSIVTDTGWTIDVLSFEQSPEQHEGPFLSFCWIDEPPRPSILGAIMSRFAGGGVALFTMTPIRAGVVLDIIEDLERKGTKVVRQECTIFDNDKETGILNSRGTKRGLWTKQQIADYIATIPAGEEQERLYGKASLKSGKIFKDFSLSIHKRDFDIDSDYFRKANHYMVMDPHQKYYPFIQWWAFTQDEMNICWNEWPNYKELGGFYDEKRLTTICNYTPEQIAGIIKVLDGEQFGLKIIKRIVDPRFARGTENSWAKETQGLVAEYANHGIRFELPSFDSISTGRTAIIDCLRYDKQRPIGLLNTPTMFILPHCVNTLRALDRHGWEPDTTDEKESEQYKDPIDCIRYYMAGKRSGWVDMEPRKVDAGIIKSDTEAYLERAGFKSTRLA